MGGQLVLEFSSYLMPSSQSTLDKSITQSYDCAKDDIVSMSMIICTKNSAMKHLCNLGLMQN